MPRVRGAMQCRELAARPAEGEGALVGLQVDARDEDDVAPALAGSDLTLEQAAVDDLEQDQSGACR
eukprot:CAMPEP_0196708894 /NCGR_PEP_ID=MMETSP1090-20130531/67002_1 /TAXON_ID=37098 /ORGANISM="Isochrysis sp, Strain CCMP1244" /LENGTH=65 /DNA_ID=CAMNT_0042048899 /DNA_START=110 /DNA_END=304 /DNA_ORIENTATION=+